MSEIHGMASSDAAGARKCTYSRSRDIGASEKSSSADLILLAPQSRHADNTFEVRLCIG